MREARSLTISKTPSGKYYVSVLAETGMEIPEAKEVKAGTSTDIDLGFTTFLTTSYEIRIQNPRNLRQSEKLLTKRQRQLSKKKKGSNNRNKARLKL